MVCHYRELTVDTKNKTSIYLLTWENCWQFARAFIRVWALIWGNTEIPTLPIWCLASRSPDFYQILPIYYKILKTREKLLIFRIFGNLSLWNTHILSLLSSQRALWYVMTVQAHKVSSLTWLRCKIMADKAKRHDRDSSSECDFSKDSHNNDQKQVRKKTKKYKPDTPRSGRRCIHSSRLVLRLFPKRSTSSTAVVAIQISCVRKEAWMMLPNMQVTIDF